MRINHQFIANMEDLFENGPSLVMLWFSKAVRFLAPHVCKFNPFAHLLGVKARRVTTS